MNNSFENRKISDITVISGSPEPDVYMVGQGRIAKIEDKSIEYEDSIHFIYHCYDKHGKIVKILVNCPVDITYREKGE